MKRVSRRRVAFYLLLITAGTVLGCGKSSFLDKKPDTRLVVPTTLNDFQTLLDNQYVMQETPELGELSADNYYTSFSVWQGLVVKEQNAYLWAKDIYDGQGQVPDWDIPYQQVFYANVVLDGLKKIKTDETNQTQWNTIKGTALFLRAYAFHNLSQIFAPLYDSSGAASDNGIPLRVTSNVNDETKRANVQATYDTILTNLKEAVGLLPVTVPYNNPNRPSQPAAWALLARVCLSMRAYNLAGTYADNCLQLYNKLMRYDTIDYMNDPIPIKNPNAETLYQSVMLRSSGIFVGGGFRLSVIVDSNLYASYKPGDRRKFIYYRTSSGLPTLSTSYNGSGYCFTGLATDEVYLIRAECKARKGDRDGALYDLNSLLQRRWDSVGFSPITAADASDALDSILVERRKELAFRGLRWSDLRRLNKEGARDTIYHGFSKQSSPVYRLSPGGPNYVLPIPPDVLSISKIPDNPRINPN